MALNYEEMIDWNFSAFCLRLSCHLFPFLGLFAAFFWVILQPEHATNVKIIRYSATVGEI